MRYVVRLKTSNLYRAPHLKRNVLHTNRRPSTDGKSVHVEHCDHALVELIHVQTMTCKAKSRVK